MPDPTAGSSDTPALLAAGPKRRSIIGLFHQALGHGDDYILGSSKALMSSSRAACARIEGKKTPHAWAVNTDRPVL